MNLAATHMTFDARDEVEDDAETEIQNNLERVRSRARIHAPVSTDHCPWRRKVRSMCENLRDQFLSRKAPHWVKPVRYNQKRFPNKPDYTVKYKKHERRLHGELVYCCTESHTSTPDHTFDPVVESTSVHHRKPKWKVDRSCASTWVAMTLHLTVMIIIVASVLTYIIDSLNYEYCMNTCPTFTRLPDDTVANCSLPVAERMDPAGCNPVGNIGVPCDKLYGDDSLGSQLQNSSVNFYCTYHVAKGKLEDETIFVFDVFFTVVFTLELLVRLVVAESYCKKRTDVKKPSTPFFADGLNWCDFLAILPLPLQEIMLQAGIDNSLRTEALVSQTEAGVLSSLAILLQLFKLLRVIRVFKIARHFSGTRVMVKTVQKSLRPVRLTFIVLFLVFTVLGSALMLFEPCYGAPGTDECQFPDLFTAGYFLMITILTVGYGDQTPKTDIGRLIGILCMILGSCFLAMPLAIVGNKFQAAYEQEQAENSRHSSARDDHITKAQRQQRLLNEAYIMLATIDHLQRVAGKSEDQRESAIGNMFKTHRVLAKDMAVLFPDLKPSVTQLLKNSDDVEEDDEDEERRGCCAPKKGALKGGAKVAPLSAAVGAKGEASARAAAQPDLDPETERELEEEEEERTAAEMSKDPRDKLWLCMEVHSSSKCAMAGYIVRHLVVILALLECMFTMFHELNRWDETSTPCQRSAAQWCNTILSLPEDWTYDEDVMLDASGRWLNATKATLLAANPICSNMTCGTDLVCTNGTAGQVGYGGCTSENSCFDNGTAWRQPVKCPVANESDPVVRTRTVYTPTFAVITETSVVTEYDTNRDFFDTSTLSMRLMADATPVCDRLVCRDNSQFAYVLVLRCLNCAVALFRIGTQRHAQCFSIESIFFFFFLFFGRKQRWMHSCSPFVLSLPFLLRFSSFFASLTQDDLNFLFGLAEAFFCLWFVGEFLLRVIGARSCGKFTRSVANWLELVCAAIAVYELAALCLQHSDLYYEVWGLPFAPDFPTDHVRPLRVIVPLRFLLMSRSYSGADVLVETAKKAAPKLAIPVFFLMIMLVIFAGVYFAVETQMDCHVEKVNENTYDDGAEVYQFVRDVAGDKCDLQDILDGMWLTIVTVTSVGYGRFYPRNITGQLLSILVAIVGAFYMAMPLAIVGTTFYNAYKLKEEARARIHVKRKFKKAVGMIQSFIRRGKSDTTAQSGLSEQEVQSLEEYIDVLGPPEQFQPTPETLQALRQRHLATMAIIGHMLATSDVDGSSATGMFR